MAGSIKPGLRRLRSFLSPVLGRPKMREQWARVVMDRETLALIEARGPESMKVLEISGEFWRNRCKFREYTNVHYPDYDVCAAALIERFDLIIAEQVFEHLAWPYRAVKHVYEMLNPGGFFLVTTPFLLKLHPQPLDCSRWSASGMRHLLAEGGFPIERIEASCWGNRSCVVSNLDHWVGYRRGIHSLGNEPEFPIVVWAVAQKA
jgi:SAM-dependent methyltransferase